MFSLRKTSKNPPPLPLRETPISPGLHCNRYCLGCEASGRLHNLGKAISSLAVPCLLTAFPVITLPLILQLVIYCTSPEQKLLCPWIITPDFFFLKNNNVILYLLFLMPILFLQDGEFSCGTPQVNAVNDWSCSSYSWFSLSPSAAPVLDQDTLLLGAIKTAQRQSPIKYCGLRIMSYKLAIQCIITSAAGF